MVSHYLLDGLGLVVALADALLGNTRDLGYPPPRSRTRLRAAVQDARETARDAPEVVRALVMAAKLARKQARGQRHNIAQSPALRPVTNRGGDRDDAIVLPGIAIAVDLDVWNGRAQALGGTSNTLVAALAARLAEHIGRRRAGDGAVTLQLPVSQRTEDDARAIAVSFARVSVDPTQVTTDLHDLRAAIKQALKALRETRDETPQILWLTPFMPKRALKRLGDAIDTNPDLPVSCSNLGDMGSVVCRLDGTYCEYGVARGTRQHVTRQRRANRRPHERGVFARAAARQDFHHRPRLPTGRREHQARIA